MKYSITLSSFRKIESLGSTLARLKEQKFDAVEMFGEPDQINLKELEETLASHDMPVCGITGMWGRESEYGQSRKLLSSDTRIVNHTEDYVKKCIRMCQVLGGSEVNVCLFADDDHAFDANHSVLSEEKKQRILENVIPVISSLVRFASDHSVDLLIEPLNRYSTPYCATVENAIYIARRINRDNLGLLLDTFHMNIEESSMEDAIHDARDFLRHAHFADNNRTMPGNGHLDFSLIVKALKKIRYDRFVSFEPNLSETDYKSTTLDGLRFVKALENSNYD